MNEAELPQGSPKAIKIGTHFPFGNSFAHSMFCPICCFPQGLSDLSHTHPFMVLAVRIRSGSVESCAEIAP